VVAVPAVLVLGTACIIMPYATLAFGILTVTAAIVVRTACRHLCLANSQQLCIAAHVLPGSLVLQTLTATLRYTGSSRGRVLWHMTGLITCSNIKRP